MTCPLALKITGKEADFSRITDKKMLPKYVMALGNLIISGEEYPPVLKLVLGKKKII